jgi:hypothetical protein
MVVQVVWHNAHVRTNRRLLSWRRLRPEPYERMPRPAIACPDRQRLNRLTYPVRSRMCGTRLCRTEQSGPGPCGVRDQRHAEANQSGVEQLRLSDPRARAVIARAHVEGSPNASCPSALTRRASSSRAATPARSTSRRPRSARPRATPCVREPASAALYVRPRRRASSSRPRVRSRAAG